MMRMPFKRLLSDVRGSMAIETAIVAPTLILMTLGTFEVGTIVARQHELQSAASEAESIVLAANMGPTVELIDMESIIRDSVNLPADNITIGRDYRCNTSSGKVKDKGACPTSASISEYIEIAIVDTYVPTWTKFGVGGPINYQVVRSVQIS